MSMARRVLLLLLLVRCSRPLRRDPTAALLDNLTRGMQIAKDFLGSESVALKVAEFVVKAFQPNNRGGDRRPEPLRDTHLGASSTDEERYENRPYASGNEGENAMNPLKHIVKLFGLQPTQLSAVAVNALLFVAQLISSLLAGPGRRGKPDHVRPDRAGDPLTWLLNKRSKSLQELIEAAKNESLPNDLENLVEDTDSEEETSCIKLLICKITPFVSKMQQAVFGENVATTNRQGAAVMYRHLPTKEEINEKSNVCEHKHRQCDLNDD